VVKSIALRTSREACGMAFSGEDYALTRENAFSEFVGKRQKMFNEVRVQERPVYEIDCEEPMLLERRSRFVRLMPDRTYPRHQLELRLTLCNRHTDHRSIKNAQADD